MLVFGGCVEGVLSLEDLSHRLLIFVAFLFDLVKFVLHLAGNLVLLLVVLHQVLGHSLVFLSHLLLRLLLLQLQPCDIVLHFPDLIIVLGKQDLLIPSVFELHFLKFILIELFQLSTLHFPHVIGMFDILLHFLYFIFKRIYFLFMLCIDGF